MEQKQLQTYATDKAFDPIYVTDNSELMAKNAADLNQSMAVYGQMQRENDQTKIANAKKSGDGLVALSKFSKNLSNYLIKEKQQQNQRDMEEGLALAYTEGTSPESQAQFEADEAALVETDAQVREVGGALPPTTSPDVRRGVSNLSGWKGYGYAQGMAQKGAQEYPIAYQQLAQQVEVTVGGKAITMNTAQTGPERQAVEAEIRRRFLQKYAGMNTNLLAKYLFPQMKRYETGQYMEWQKEQTAAFELEQKDEAKEFLFDSIKNNRGGEGVMQFIQQYSGTFGGKSKAWDVIVDELKSGIKNRDLTQADIEAIKETVVTVDGKQVKIGDRWSRRFAGMDDLLHQASLTDSKQRQEREALIETQFQDQIEQATKDKIARGEAWDEGDIEELEKKWKSMTGKEPPSWLSDMKTREEGDAEDISKRLLALRRSRGYLIEDDLRHVPSKLWERFQSMVAEDKHKADAASEYDGSAKERITALVNSSSVEYQGDKEKDDRWFQVRDNAIEDYETARDGYLRQGMAPKEAHFKALGEVRERFLKDGVPKDINDLTDFMRSGPKQSVEDRVMIATVKQAITSSKGAILDSQVDRLPGMKDSDLAMAEKYQRGETNTIPRVFQVAAQDSSRHTAWDIMNNQLIAAGKKPLMGPVHEEINNQADPEVERLLKWKPTVSRVNRAIVAGGPSIGDPLVAMVISRESAGKGVWDAYNQGGSAGGHVAHNSGNSSISSPWNKPIQQMTIGEIKYFQSLPIGHPKVLHAAGAFQFVGTTFRETAARLGVSDDQVFDPATQLAFFHDRRKWRMEVDPGVSGLRREWIGLTHESTADIEAAMKPYYSRPENMLPGI